MPMSKPFTASSLADSWPIPESDAVTMATGLMLAPLDCKTVYPALCSRRGEHKQSTVLTRSSRYLHRRDRECSNAACLTGSPDLPLRIISSLTPRPLLTGDLHLHHTFGIEAHLKGQQPRCRDRRRPTRGRSRSRA